MRNVNSSEFRDAIVSVLKGYPNDFSFPFGDDDIEIPLPSERVLIETFFTNQPFAPTLVIELRSVLDVKLAYSLVILTVRFVLYSVRISSPRLFRLSLPFLLADDNLVDWRDILVAASIIDDCARHLSIDFSSEIQSLLGYATERRRDTILCGYLSRDTEMKQTDVFGVLPRTGPEGLSYLKVRN
jgi:hypothetical protein